VRLASDAVPVCIHDATLTRTALREGRVESLSSKELREVDAGTWFNLRFPSLARESFTRERIPALAEVFERFGARDSKLYVELKCDEPSSYAPLAASVVRLVREYAMTTRVVVKCFAHEAIREVKRLAPEIRTAALFEPKLARPFIPAGKIIADALDCGADEISLHRSLVRRAVVEEARRRGLATLTWTVDAPSWVSRASRLGLRAIITNHPARMRAASEELLAAS
jgi:glycerophosphoryl diester phosphodiesterase